MRSAGNREHAPTGRLNLSPGRSQERRVILSCPYNDVALSRGRTGTLGRRLQRHVGPPHWMLMTVSPWKQKCRQTDNGGSEYTRRKVSSHTMTGARAPLEQPGGHEKHRKE
jgi:hypothetical protein